MSAAHLDLHNMTLEDYFFTKNTRYVVWGIAGVVVVLLAIHAVLAVNSRHSKERRPDDAFFAFVPSPGVAYIEGGHGAIGTINNLDLPHFTLVTRGGMTQAVYAGSSTVVTLRPGLATTTNALQNGFVVMVIGDPDFDDQNAGYIDARIIRVLPPPPTRK
jgi:hypothetical protein